jgi:hypothetical protein
MKVRLEAAAYWIRCGKIASRSFMPSPTAESGFKQCSLAEDGTKLLRALVACDFSG